VTDIDSPLSPLPSKSRVRGNSKIVKSAANVYTLCLKRRGEFVTCPRSAFWSLWHQHRYINLDLPSAVLSLHHQDRNILKILKINTLTDHVRYQNRSLKQKNIRWRPTKMSPLDNMFHVRKGILKVTKYLIYFALLLLRANDNIAQQRSYYYLRIHTTCNARVTGKVEF
jgi:hypothetical protein